MITARILTDSINPAGKRLTTWLLTYPRFIHSEFMTHRTFSRNAASSRARSMRATLKDVRENPATPVRWPAEQKGMQGGDELHGAGLGLATLCDRTARHACLENAEAASVDAGLHKSVANRWIEPWMHMTTLATATDHTNFFSLRAHPMAQPEFQVLAFAMLDAYLASVPRVRQWGEWHIPQFRNMTAAYEAADSGYDIQTLLKISTARCARLSFLTFDGLFAPEKDVELHDGLKGNRHLSPFEHCAQAICAGEPGAFTAYPWSNFDVGYVPHGWGQYRKLIENEAGPESCNLGLLHAGMPEWVRLQISADKLKAIGQ